MVGWHHWLDVHGFRWTPAVGDGYGGLACCGLWGRKEFHTTKWLNWTGKTIALTIWTFVNKVVSLLFNILSMLGSQNFVYDWSDWAHTHAVCYSFPAKKQSSSNFMAEVPIHCDFRAQEEEICHCLHIFGDSFPSGSYSKESACIVGDPGSIPGLKRSLENEMVSHSSILAWKIPWRGA